MIKLEFTIWAKDYFIDNVFSVDFGARPLKRLVSHKLETLIAKSIIDNTIKPNCTITIDYDKEKEDIVLR